MPGEPDCTFGPGQVVPIVNRERCENKGPCVTVCPYDVFVIRPVPEEDKRTLRVLTRLKVWAHGNKQAYADFADRCQGCGLCVDACPEGAITLKRAR